MRSLLGPLLDGLRNQAPVPFVGRGMEGRWGGRGKRVDMVAQQEALGASATLFSVVNRTTTAVAAETWHLHRRAPGKTCVHEDGEGELCGAKNVINVDRHPALQVLSRPNGFYTTQEYFESGQQHVDLTGEGWTILSRIGQVPVEMWVARPDRMIVVTDRRDFLVGYIYVDPDGTEMPIRKEDVMSIRMPNPLDPYRGLGPVQSILPNIDAASYSAEWNANYFRNGARPGGIVKLSRKMSDPDFDQLVERFNINHRGITNANRTAFLEEGDWVDVKPMSMRDMMFVETAELNRDTILLAFGMSGFAVGIVDDVNRATADASSAWFAEYQTVPRLDRWKGMLNGDFLPQFPGYVPGDVSFAYSNPIPADREAEREDKRANTQNYVLMLDAGVDPQVAAEVNGFSDLKVGPPRRGGAPARSQPATA